MVDAWNSDPVHVLMISPVVDSNTVEVSGLRDAPSETDWFWGAPSTSSAASPRAALSPVGLVTR